MDIKNDKKAEKKKARKSNLFLMRMMNPLRYQIFNSVFGTIRLIIGLIAIAALVYFILAGGINQKETLDTFKNTAMNIGQKIGEFFNSLVTDESPLNFSEDGVYLKDAEIPEDGLIDNSIETIFGGTENPNNDGEDKNSTVNSEEDISPTNSKE